MELSTQIAKDLLSIRAVFFRPQEPFTWASGIKSPVYCDNRLTLTAPAVRNDVENGLAHLIQTHYPDVQGISWGCPWAMSATGPRTMAVKIRSRAVWNPARR